MIEEVDKKLNQAEEIIEKLKNLIDNYNPMVSSEIQDKRIQKNKRLAQKLLNDAGDYLEVEDFLLYGPKGKDPK